MANNLKIIASELPDGCWPVLTLIRKNIWHARISGPSANKNWVGEGDTMREALAVAVRKAKAGNEMAAAMMEAKTGEE